jgi:hypothetical protein
MKRYEWRYGRPVRELEDLLADGRADDAASERQRTRLLRQISEEEATLAGLLLDLAERATSVTMETAGAGSHRGVVRMVAKDFCVVATDVGDVWLTFAGLTVVRPHPGERHPPASGQRAAVDIGLAEALGRVVGERPPIRVIAAGGQRVAGELRSAGIDVLSIRIDGPEAGVVYVPVSSVRAVFRSG